MNISVVIYFDSLVGYSSKHFGYVLLEWETERVVVRGDIHCLTFHPTRFRHRQGDGRPNPREEEGAVVFELDEEDVASPQSTPPSRHHWHDICPLLLLRLLLVRHMVVGFGSI